MAEQFDRRTALRRAAVIGTITVGYSAPVIRQLDVRALAAPVSGSPGGGGGTPTPTPTTPATTITPTPTPTPTTTSPSSSPTSSAPSPSGRPTSSAPTPSVSPSSNPPSPTGRPTSSAPAPSGRPTTSGPGTRVLPFKRVHSQSGSTLPFTGLNVTGFLETAATAVGLGAMLNALGRRRQPATVQLDVPADGSDRGGVADGAGPPGN